MVSPPSGQHRKPRSVKRRRLAPRKHYTQQWQWRSKHDRITGLLVPRWAGPIKHQPPQGVTTKWNTIWKCDQSTWGHQESELMISGDPACVIKRVSLCHHSVKSSATFMAHTVTSGTTPYKHKLIARIFILSCQFLQEIYYFPMKGSWIMGNNVFWKHSKCEDYMYILTHRMIQKQVPVTLLGTMS
jgi:hypothetical protein